MSMSSIFFQNLKFILIENINYFFRLCFSGMGDDLKQILDEENQYKYKYTKNQNGYDIFGTEFTT